METLKMAFKLAELEQVFGILVKAIFCEPHCRAISPFICAWKKKYFHIPILGARSSMTRINCDGKKYKYCRVQNIEHLLCPILILP